MATAGNRIAHEVLEVQDSTAAETVPKAHVLTSWKEIASYVGKSVRTVQRWESELGLPVRRPNPGDRNIVLAVPEELDRWLLRRLTPRANFPVGCSAELARMAKLVSVMQIQTELTRHKTEDLIKNFKLTTARAAAMAMKKNGMTRD